MTKDLLLYFKFAAWFKLFEPRLTRVLGTDERRLRENEQRRTPKPQAASSAGVGREEKRETAMVLYSNSVALASVICPPGFKYHTPVSNVFREWIEAVSVRCDEWFNAKEECTAYGEKLKFRSAVSICFLSFVQVFV